MKNTQKNKIIPIFFAVDDNYAPYLAVALTSLKANSSAKNIYEINVLVEHISDGNKRIIEEMASDNIKITFFNLSEKLRALCTRLHLRDYYTKATYYRFFIPKMFPQYDKGLYLDCDIVINRDVADMYNTPIGSNLVGAITDEIVTETDVFGRYTETVLGIPRNKYFNAGILVMNLAEMRKTHIEETFSSLLSIKTYAVAQDQDYLNVICYGRVKYLNKLWNKTPFPTSDPKSIPHIAHYKINFKPWKYDGVTYGEQFWKYAKETPFYSFLLAEKNRYTETEKARDAEQYDALIKLAEKEIRAEEVNSSQNEDLIISGLEMIARDYIRGNRRLARAEKI